MKLRVKNWDEFQHYKDRCPPWIKLHKNLLDDYEFHCLPVASRALAPCLWLIASEDLDGVIDANTEKLSFRLRQTQKQIDDALTPLIEKGFFIKEQSASNALADRKQDAPLDRGETEAETYKTEAEKKAAKAAVSAKKKKSQIPENFGNPFTPALQEWLDRRGETQAKAHLIHFVGYAKANAKTYADWDQAFQNAVRDDWAGIRRVTA